MVADAPVLGAIASAHAIPCQVYCGSSAFGRAEHPCRVGRLVQREGCWLWNAADVEHGLESYRCCGVG